jgi:hypothetical protein
MNSRNAAKAMHLTAGAFRFICEADFDVWCEWVLGRWKEGLEQGCRDGGVDGRVPVGRFGSAEILM